MSPSVQVTVLTNGAATYSPGVSERRGSSTTFLHSGIKNADAQSGTAQTVAATRQYVAFGNLVSSSSGWQGPFGYAGGFGYQEDATGLKLLGHRYKDSSTGRFLTRDPIKDGRNWYAYCAGDPVGGTDPAGLYPWSWLVRSTVVNRSDETVIVVGDYFGPGGQPTAIGITLPPGSCSPRWLDSDMVYVPSTGHWDPRNYWFPSPGIEMVVDDRGIVRATTPGDSVDPFKGHRYWDVLVANPVHDLHEWPWEPSPRPGRAPIDHRQPLPGQPHRLGSSPIWG